MNAITKRRPRAATEPAADYGPRQRIKNGTAVLTYRADPDKPNAPAIRGAEAYCAYDDLHGRGVLSDAEREAADKIVMAVEAHLGARWGGERAEGGKAHWQCGGPTPMMVQAAATLRELNETLDRATHDAVIRLVCNNDKTFYARAQAGLAAMAKLWNM